MPNFQSILLIDIGNNNNIKKNMLFSFNESLWQGSNDQQQQHFASSLAIIIIRYWDNIHFSSGPLGYYFRSEISSFFYLKKFRFFFVKKNVHKNNVCILKVKYIEIFLLSIYKEILFSVTFDETFTFLFFLFFNMIININLVSLSLTLALFIRYTQKTLISWWW